MYNRTHTEQQRSNVKREGTYIMNLIKTLIARIEEYRATNKSPCKSYASEASAEKAAEQYAAKIVSSFTDEKFDLEYVVFYNPAWDRWCVAFRTGPLLQKYGGYMGVASEYGFFSY